jgi:hypothetical protein
MGRLSGNHNKARFPGRVPLALAYMAEKDGALPLQRFYPAGKG